MLIMIQMVLVGWSALMLLRQQNALVQWLQIEVIPNIILIHIESTCQPLEQLHKLVTYLLTKHQLRPFPGTPISLTTLSTIPRNNRRQLKLMEVNGALHLKSNLIQPTLNSQPKWVSLEKPSAHGRSQLRMEPKPQVSI